MLLPRLALVPGLAGRVLDSETPALRRSGLVLRPRLWRFLAGRLCFNAVLHDDRRFDDVTDGRFAVVTAAAPSDAERAATHRRGAVLIAEPPDELRRWRRTGRARTAVVRPSVRPSVRPDGRTDGTVLCAGRDVSRLCRRLPRFDLGLR